MCAEEAVRDGGQYSLSLSLSLSLYDSLGLLGGCCIVVSHVKLLLLQQYAQGRAHRGGVPGLTYLTQRPFYTPYLPEAEQRSDAEAGVGGWRYGAYIYKPPPAEQAGNLRWHGDGIAISIGCWLRLEHEGDESQPWT